MFYAIVICGLRVLRVSYGPLPIFLCNIAGFLNGCAILFVAITVTQYTFTRFMFVCIWKRMRQMDDNLIVRIATIQAIVLSLLFQAATWFQLQGQATIPVSFFSYFVPKIERCQSITYVIILTSGLYRKSAKIKLHKTRIFNISIHLFVLHSHYNWINDCNKKETSH